MSLKDIYEMTLNLLFPRDVTCGLCGMELGARLAFDLCQECTDDLEPILEYGCVKCGRKVGPFALEGKCPHCMGSGTVFMGGFSAFTYTEGTKELVYGLKYNQKPWLAHSMAMMMADGVRKLCDENGIEMIVPVPIHKERKLERTYNQAELLAKDLSIATGIPCNGTVLERIKNTVPQNQLKIQERAGNLKGAFRAVVNEQSKGLNILLVDDVLTTGMTLNSCAKMLLEAGAGGVWVASFASVTGQ